MRFAQAVYLPLTIFLMGFLYILLWQMSVIRKQSSPYTETLYRIVLEEAKWSTKDRTDVIIPANTNVKYNKTEYHEHKNLSEIFLIILVTSHSSHFYRRFHIRSTWARDSAFKPRWKTLFLVGKSKEANITKLKRMEKICKQENALHRDLIKLDFVEDFYNLTYKLWKGFSWALNNAMFSYLLKVDDDVFVNVPKLLIFLQDPKVPKSKLYAGNCYESARVQRDGKYGISKKDYPNASYPGYCSGGGFVLSRDVAHKIVELYDHKKAIIIDDVYVGILVNQAGVKVTDYGTEKFEMFGLHCKFNQHTLVQHPATDNCLKTLYVTSVESILGIK